MLNRIGAALGVRKREATVLIIGLDYAGKSTLVNRLKPKDVQATDVPPTVGCALEKISTKSMNMNIIDMAGQSECVRVCAPAYICAQVATVHYGSNIWAPCRQSCSVSTRPTAFECA
jgi:GTPase SAR1 family protein